MIPERIWLQWDDSKYEFDCRCITWCDSPIPEADNIECIRAPQWVSVEDRLPENGRELWVTWGDIVFEGNWGNEASGGFYTDGGRLLPITNMSFFWCYRFSYPRPLPAPPKA